MDMTDEFSGQEEGRHRQRQSKHRERVGRRRSHSTENERAEDHVGPVPPQLGGLDDAEEIQHHDEKWQQKGDAEDDHQAKQKREIEIDVLQVGHAALREVQQDRNGLGQNDIGHEHSAGEQGSGRGR